MADEIDSKGPESPKRRRGNPNWRKGGPSPNAGGRSKKLVAIEAMLNDKHRSVANMEKVFNKLRELAVDGAEKGIYFKGVKVDTEVQYEAAFMRLYLERTLGPVRDPVSDAELDDWIRKAPPEALAYLRTIPVIH